MLNCVIVFVLIPLPLVSTTTTNLTNQSGIATWRPILDNSLSVLGLPSKQFPAKSLMTCIVQCTNRNTRCNVVTYHKAQGTCKPGFLIYRPNGKYSSSTSLTANEVIYSKMLNACDIRRGFDLRYNTKVILCLQTFPVKQDYDGAERTCRQNGGRVFALHDASAFSLLNGIVDLVYIGLRKKGQRFYWTDGKELFNGTSVWRDLWAPGEPSSPGLECTVLGNDYRLHSADCARHFQFICETPIF